jgi:hypothetical protein
VDGGSNFFCVAVFRVACSHRSCTARGVSPGPPPMYSAVKQYIRLSIYFTTFCCRGFFASAVVMLLGCAVVWNVDPRVHAR